MTPATPNSSAPSIRVIFTVYFALLVILTTSAALSRVLTGTVGASVGLLLASMKLALIFSFFMRLKYQIGLVRLFAAAGFFWLGLFGMLVMADYLAR